MSAQIITPAQQQQVLRATTATLQQASELLGKSFAPIPVRFNLSGRAAGMYRVKQHEREIRYNPYLFFKYFDDNLANTVPHEVAHYVVDCCHGFKNVRPHGVEWRELMLMLGVEPTVTCRYDMSDIPQRRQRRIEYHCGCRAHQLSTIRHNRVQRGEARYHCKACRNALVLKSA